MNRLIRRESVVFKVAWHFPVLWTHRFFPHIGFVMERVNIMCQAFTSISLIVTRCRDTNQSVVKTL